MIVCLPSKKKVQPIRIAARRQRELMAILAQDELGIEEA
jgi:hypothetical protein